VYATFEQDEAPAARVDDEAKLLAGERNLDRQEWRRDL
jgi:hypothetical protein